MMKQKFIWVVFGLVFGLVIYWPIAVFSQSSFPAALSGPVSTTKTATVEASTTTVSTPVPAAVTQPAVTTPAPTPPVTPPPVATPPTPSAEPTVTTIAKSDVAIVYSNYTKAGFSNAGWNYDEYFGYVKTTFEKLKITYATVTDDDVESGRIIGNCKLLVLPNMRDMSAKQVQQVTEFAKNGGKIFATYTSSFRDEKDQVRDPRNFGLAEVFGVKYESWSDKVPQCGSMRRVADAAHPIWKDLPEFVRVFRYTTMAVSVPVKETAIAVWYNEDKKTASFSDDRNNAIVLNNNSVYCAEDLFAPENCHNKIVRQLITNIVNYLLTK